MTVAKVAPGTRARSRRRTHVTVRALVLGALIVALGVAFTYPVRMYLDQRNQIGTLSRQTQVLEQNNTQLEQLITRLRDPAYLEQIARQCWGYVANGEISFLLVPKGAHQTPAAPPPQQQSGAC